MTYLLKFKEHRRISQVAIDDVVQSSKGLFLQTIERVQAAVRAKLAESRVDPNSINGLGEAFETVVDPFEGIIFKRNISVKNWVS